MKDLETKNLKIRKFKMDDVEDVYKNLATIQELKNCSEYHIHKNIYETSAMVSSFIREYETGELALAVEEKATSTVIAYIRSLEVSLPDKRCDIKFGITFSKFNTNLIEEALNAVLDYLFNQLDLCIFLHDCSFTLLNWNILLYFNIVISKFYDSNKKLTETKCEMLENVGMKKDAVLRNRKINEKTGKSENLIVYSIMKNEKTYQ